MSDCLATPLALASSWKSKGAAPRIVKDKGAPDLSNPSKPTGEKTDQCKELEDSDAAKQRSPGLCRDKAEASSSFRMRIAPSLALYRRSGRHLANRGGGKDGEPEFSSVSSSISHVMQDSTQAH